MSARQPADGTAVVLHLIEAARAYAMSSTPDDVRQNGLTLAMWVGELDARFKREQPAPAPVSWEPRVWREVVAGDKVAMGGVEALVTGVLVSDWHVDPRSNEYRPAPLEHTIARVTLLIDGQENVKTYPFPAGGEVECLRGEAGQAVDEVNRYRSAFLEEPINVMESWAAEAAQTLEAAGLGPIEVMDPHQL